MQCTCMLSILQYFTLYMQYPKNELELDAEHICSLIEYEQQFAERIKTLTHQEVKEAVIETFNLLFSAPGPHNADCEVYLTLEGSVIVSIVQQILIRLLTKRLMNLMTAEALIVNRNKLPSIYLWHYLSGQAHFSLKDTITNYHGTLRATIRYTRIFFHALAPILMPLSILSLFFQRFFKKSKQSYLLYPIIHIGSRIACSIF